MIFSFSVTAQLEAMVEAAPPRTCRPPYDTKLQSAPMLLQTLPDGAQVDA